MFNTHHDDDRTAPRPGCALRARPVQDQREGLGEERAEVRVRLEGAPWLSLRDRCGAETLRPRRSRRDANRSSRRSAKRADRAVSWRSLSRIEVAMVLVMGVLLAAVFRGAQHEAQLALAPAEATPFATVSLVE